MPARLNHVSVVAVDLAASVRFYVDELGLEPLPTPCFGSPTQWLAAGERQLHLFERADTPPVNAHFALEIDDFLPTYRRMKEIGALDGETFGRAVVELPDGALQLYVRDPAGNLVELDYRDGATVPRDEVPELKRLADLFEQEPASQGATLWHAER